MRSLRLLNKAGFDSLPVIDWLTRYRMDSINWYSFRYDGENFRRQQWLIKRIIHSLAGLKNQVDNKTDVLYKRLKLVRVKKSWMIASA